MKLLSTKEVQDRKQGELTKDLARTETVKKALEDSTNQLNEVNARFNLALANQRVRFAQEEKEHLEKLSEIKKEIEVLEIKRKELLVPLDEREKKSYALITEAGEIYNRAQDRYHESEQKNQDNERTSELLQEKLDGVYEKEASLEEREKKVTVREMAVEEERAMIRNLSSELTKKLTNL